MRLLNLKSSIVANLLLLKAAKMLGIFHTIGKTIQHVFIFLILFLRQPAVAKVLAQAFWVI